MLLHGHSLPLFRAVRSASFLVFVAALRPPRRLRYCRHAVSNADVDVPLLMLPRSRLVTVTRFGPIALFQLLL